MSVTFIPNQPVIFSPDTQTGKNNDQQQYAMLVQPNDPIYIQVQCGVVTDYSPVLEKEGLLNETFTGSATGWALSGGWSYASNNLVGTAVPVIAPAQSPSFQVYDNKEYFIDFDLVATIGDVWISIHSGVDESYPTFGSGYNSTGHISDSIINLNTDGVYALNFFPPANDFTGTIDNVIVSSWEEITTGVFHHESGVGVDGLQTQSILTGTNYIKVVFTISDYVDGTITPSLTGGGGVTGAAVTGNGSHVWYVDSLGDGRVKLTPSLDFSGTVQIESVEQINNGYEFYIINPAGNPIGEDHDATHPNFPVEYYDDRAIWFFGGLNLLEAGGIGVDLDFECYTIGVRDTLDGNVEYESTTVLHYKNTHANTYKVIATNESRYAYGFLFNDSGTDVFKLEHRLKLLRISPRYVSEINDYIDSAGNQKKRNVQNAKTWVGWFDYLSEEAFDVLDKQTQSDHFFIGTVEYYCPEGSMEPEWAENMKRNLARVRIDLQRKGHILFKRNC